MKGNMMLKKSIIALGVLAIFVGVFLVHAQTSVRYHYEAQYIDALNMPWHGDRDVLKLWLNEFYDKPENTTWELECIDGFCQPYYEEGLDKHYIKTMYEFGALNKLRGVHAYYDVVGYSRLIKRIEEDFSNRAVVSAYQYTHHIYDKTSEKSTLKVEVKHYGVNKPVKFSIRYKPIIKKEEITNDKEVAVANAGTNVLYSPAVRTVFACVLILNGNVNL
jgi:hypothetical protein